MLLATANNDRQRGLGCANIRGIARSCLFTRFAETATLCVLLQQIKEGTLQFRQGNPILWPFWTSNAGDDCIEVQLQNNAVINFAFARNAKHALRFEITPYCFNLL